MLIVLCILVMLDCSNAKTFGFSRTLTKCLKITKNISTIYDPLELMELSTDCIFKEKSS